MVFDSTSLQSKCQPAQSWQYIPIDLTRGSANCEILSLPSHPSTGFTHVTSWIRNIASFSSPVVPKILVANKVDDVANRQVPTEAGVQFASALGIPYYECSATDYDSVEPIFLHMTKLVLANLHNIAPGYADAAAAPTVDITQPAQPTPSGGCKC